MKAAKQHEKDLKKAEKELAAGNRTYSGDKLQL